jgi:opacity protein-like surface antigen
MKARSNGLVAFMALAMVIFTMPASAQDPPRKFSLIFSGGYGTMAGGDMSKLIDDNNAVVGDLATLWGFTVTETFQKSSGGPGFEAEFLFRPARNFGMSISIGHIRKDEDSRGAANLAPLAAVSGSMTTAYSLIPFRLSGYYLFSIGPKLTAYTKAGVGYCLGRMSYTFRTDEMLQGRADWDQSIGKAHDSGLAFHGGLGLEYSVSPSIAFIAELAGQYLSLNDWTTENTYSSPLGSEIQSGKMWYAERPAVNTGGDSASLVVSKRIPTDTTMHNVRKAAFGFSGLAIRSGVKISF